MVKRIENPHDVTLDLDGVRHKDLVVLRGTERLGQQRLAVARRSVEEDRAPIVGRRTKLLQQLVAHHHVLKHLAEFFRVHRTLGERLSFHNSAILRQCHRRRASIAIEVRQVPRPRHAALRQRVNETHLSDATHTRPANELLLQQPLDYLPDDWLVGQANLLHDFLCRQFVPGVEDPENQFAKLAQ